MKKKYHCYICKKYKIKSEFYKDKSRRIGIASRCKNCNDGRARTRNRKEYFGRKEVKRMRAAVTKRYNQKHPHKVKIRQKTRQLLKEGVIKRSPCEICGIKNVEIHHIDYRSPYKVRWLCKRHHAKIHYHPPADT